MPGTEFPARQSLTRSSTTRDEAFDNCAVWLHSRWGLRALRLMLEPVKLAGQAGRKGGRV